MIKLQDSPSRILKALATDKILKIYLCGPTVYDDVHIGNLTPIIIFDFLIRYLRKKGIKYNYIHNITDIDDKIINRAIEKGISERKLAEEYEGKYREILKFLNVVPPTMMPRISEHIGDIQEVIEKLIKKGLAYVKEGDVMFRIGGVGEYGEVSKQRLEDLKNASDFCLWKKTDKGKKWESPWGLGRPGWHTECFALIDKYLGGRVDIHGGGVDLKFPHHENENAHCRGIHKCSLADIWMHIGHVSTKEGKISKSGNNKYLVKDLLMSRNKNLIRWICMQTHYSSPSLLSDEQLDIYEKEWNEFQRALNKSISHIYMKKGIISEWKESEVSSEVLECLEWNLNLPKVVTVLHSLKTNLLTAIKNKDGERIEWLAKELKENLVWLGFIIENVHTPNNLKLLDKWKEASEQKKWEEADSIRKILLENGLI